MTRPLALAALLVACNSPVDTDEPDPGTDPGEGTDADTEADPFAGVSADVAYTSTTLTVTLTGGSGAYELGIAETGQGVGGWYGENCLGGDAGFNECHSFTAPRLVLDLVSDRADVDAGLTTLFSQNESSDATYALFVASGDCIAWGDDPSYFSDCEETQ